MAARIGGEEFAVILPGVSAEEAARKALEILQKVSRHCFLYQGVRIEGVTVSIGLHTLQKGEECQADPFLLGADKALYQAKREGRNCVYCCARSAEEPISLEEWQKRKSKNGERETTRESQLAGKGVARCRCRETCFGEPG
jgi:predicted signal transduction protein with EAL and GGDEF domain